MVYTTDDGPLLGLWTAIRLIGVIREIEDPSVRAEILTKAQILLTTSRSGVRGQTASGMAPSKALTSFGFTPALRTSITAEPAGASRGRSPSATSTAASSVSGPATFTATQTATLRWDDGTA